jgi:sugar/nucleoside kinase (ribokinase family)
VERLADGADWLHVSGSTVGFGGRLAEAVEAAATRVLERGGRISLDPNVRPDADAGVRERMARLARAAHVLFPSEGELAALDLSAEELAHRGAVICETRGRDGALVVDGRGAEPVPVHAAVADERDSTGAGDTFAAAFVTAFKEGADVVSAAAFGCETAARSVTFLGAMEAPVEPRRA